MNEARAASWESLIWMIWSKPLTVKSSLTCPWREQIAKFCATVLHVLGDKQQDPQAGAADVVQRTEVQDHRLVALLDCALQGRLERGGVIAIDGPLNQGYQIAVLSLDFYIHGRPPERLVNALILS